MKNNDRFCTSCKQVGHVEQKCMNKSKNTNVSFVKIDYFYMLTMGVNGVHAKFVGTPIVGLKKKVTNFQGPRQVWVPKKN